MAGRNPLFFFLSLPMAMSKTENNIDHPGIVDRVEGHSVFVRIESRTACGGCASRAYCSMTDLEDKVVEVGTGEESLFVPGQAVTVSLEESLGYKALLFGYLLPFVVLLASIFLMIWITGSESLSAIAGLVLMFFYYYWLYRSREKLRRTFRFRVRA